MIEFDNVSKRFRGGTVAVDELNLTAPDGKITMLVGPSGCGKTTSLRMVNRLIEPSSGTIRVNGEDTAAADPATLRLGIGYVIQSAGLFPHRTVRDNIATVPFLLGWDKKKARNRAQELLERVGLPADMGGRYPAQLSGGQQQRVGVARALAADPPIMLMDEPFSAVDPIVRESLQDEFLRLQGELGKTIVFVTHDIDEAVKLGDLVGVFSTGGRLEQLAPPRELLASPASAFVEDFVGRDRGFRGLMFLSSDGLDVAEPVTVQSGADVDAARLAAERGGNPWVLVVDDQRRPCGWLDTAALGGVTELSSELAPLGATAGPGRSLRGVLDAALTSPAGQAVYVDDDGCLIGTVSPDQVTAAAARARPRSGDAVGRTDPVSRPGPTGGPHDGDGQT